MRLTRVLALIVMGGCVGDSSVTTDGGADATTDAAADVVGTDTGPADAGKEAEAGPQACMFPEAGVGASGTLDPGFTAQFYSNIYNTQNLTIDGSGRIYVVGWDNHGSGLCGFTNVMSGFSGAYVERFTNNGAIDTSYGTSGHYCLVVPAYPNGATVFSVAAADPDGSVVTAGFVRDVCVAPNCSGTTSGTKAIVVRLTPAGVLDTGFNSGGTTPGLLVVDAIPGDRSAAYALSLDTGYSPAKIVMGGFNNTYFGGNPSKGWVTRLNHDGSLDTIGFAAAPIVDTAAAYFGLGVVNHDIYVTGQLGPTGGVYTSQYGAVRKILGSGSGKGTFDTTFGGGNPVQVPFGPGTYATGEAVVAIPGGVAVGGWADDNPTNDAGDPHSYQTVLTGIGPDGGVVSSFGTQGSTALSYDGGPAYFSTGYQFSMMNLDCAQNAVIGASITVNSSLDSGGAGESLVETAIARMRPTGALDTTFGASGYALVGANFNSSAVTAAVEDPLTGGLVIVLRKRGGNDGQLGLVRFLR